jgi:hypothetical protein
MENLMSETEAIFPVKMDLEAGASIMHLKATR